LDLIACAALRRKLREGSGGEERAWRTDVAL